MESELYLKMRQVEDNHWWFVGRRQIGRHILSSLRLPGSARILDVGCGTGGNFKVLAEFGHVTGMECDQIAATIARGRNGVEVIQGSLPGAVPFVPSQFDLITAFDVIEHIDDDVASLATLHGLLAPGGYLLMTVPAFRFLWSDHDEQHHHRRRYDARRLRDVIERAGFELRHLTYYNTWLFPVIASVRVLEKFLPKRAVGSDIRLPGSLTNSALHTIFSSERHWVRRHKMPFGVSLLALAQKNKP